MKKQIILFISILCLYSCSSNEENSQPTATLEGNWLLQNIPSGSKLKFYGNNFMIESGTVTINGTFKLIDKKITGEVTSRKGANSEALKPDTFSGNVEITNDKVTFTNFDGNWRAIFSTWYGKQK